MTGIIEAICKVSEAFQEANLSLPILGLTNHEIMCLKSEPRDHLVCRIDNYSNGRNGKGEIMVAGIRIFERAP